MHKTCFCCCGIITSVAGRCFSKRPFEFFSRVFPRDFFSRFSSRFFSSVSSRVSSRLSFCLFSAPYFGLLVFQLVPLYFFKENVCECKKRECIQECVCETGRSVFAKCKKSPQKLVCTSFEFWSGSRRSGPRNLQRASFRPHTHSW
jgi:hypothetical protein